MLNQSFTRKAILGTAVITLAAATIVSGSRFAPTRAYASTSPPAPADLSTALARLYSIDVSSPQATDIPAIAGSEAEAIATSSFAWAGGSPPATYLVRYTDHRSARVGNGEGPVIPDRTSVTPLFTDKLVWLVAIPNATIPIIAPHGRPSGPRTYMATLCVFVDPTTRTYLKAVAIES
jgi:hypothetical protein